MASYLEPNITILSRSLYIKSKVGSTSRRKVLLLLCLLCQYLPKACRQTADLEPETMTVGQLKHAALKQAASDRLGHNQLLSPTNL